MLPGSCRETRTTIFLSEFAKFVKNVADEEKNDIGIAPVELPPFGSGFMWRREAEYVR